jgi:OOP family OmpA-OmpF porin
VLERLGDKDVLIEGHADSVGPSHYNLTLSRKRAEAVKKFLHDHGVPDRQLHTYGYGQGYFWLPHASTDKENRRVRIIECTVGEVNRCKGWA